ncbi:MAG TPA: hypothetical protein VJH24_02465 [Candidatus Bilamarchaeaceae archaeon]|nr:hypothetical protein [Candidatus Bilamarchaeaceae archaeon]
MRRIYLQRMMQRPAAGPRPPMASVPMFKPGELVLEDLAVERPVEHVFLESLSWSLGHLELPPYIRKEFPAYYGHFITVLEKAISHPQEVRNIVLLSIENALFLWKPPAFPGVLRTLYNDNVLLAIEKLSNTRTPFVQRIFLHPRLATSLLIITCGMCFPSELDQIAKQMSQASPAQANRLLKLSIRNFEPAELKRRLEHAMKD